MLERLPRLPPIPRSEPGAFPEQCAGSQALDSAVLVGACPAVLGYRGLHHGAGFLLVLVEKIPVIRARCPGGRGWTGTRDGCSRSGEMAALAPLDASSSGCWPVVAVCLATAPSTRLGSAHAADLHPLPAGGHSRTFHPGRDLSREVSRMAQPL